MKSFSRKSKAFMFLLAFILLTGCTSEGEGGKEVKSVPFTPNKKVDYDTVFLADEKNPYYIVGFSDYVFVGSITGDCVQVKLPSGNQKLRYEIQVTKNLKGRLAEVIEADYPAYYREDGTLILMQGDYLKDDALPEMGKDYIFVGTGQPDGGLLLEALYAKAENTEENYQTYLDYVKNEEVVKRDRFKSRFEVK